MNDVTVKNFKIGNTKPFTLIAGPCAIESREHVMKMAEALTKLTQKLDINFIFKSSFDKANRTSAKSLRGMGLKDGCAILSEVRERFEVPVITDVHTEEQCEEVAKHVDVLQIPAFLCRQTDLLEAAAKTGKPVMVKKGQFLAPWDMKQVVQKLETFGAKNILVCERGASFGYNTLVSDPRSIVILRETGWPVIYDATHSVQQPGGLGGTSGGQREFVPHLARGAVAIGVAGVFIETHDDPDNALSDGPNMVPLSEMEKLLTTLKQFDTLAKQNR